MSEEKMDASPVASKASKFAWLAALITGLLSFVGLAMPLVLTHGATYDAPNWACDCLADFVVIHWHSCGCCARFGRPLHQKRKAVFDDCYAHIPRCWRLLHRFG